MGIIIERNRNVITISGETRRFFDDFNPRLVFPTDGGRTITFRCVGMDGGVLLYCGDRNRWLRIQPQKTW